eukprot:NODE_710_length_4537_cov_0.398828.p1 type:complete len:359 gc:universal NODE_710_length_4537_cov_0.398828:3654-2578(-)
MSSNASMTSLPSNLTIPCAFPSQNDQQHELKIENITPIGNGSFGTVYQCTIKNIPKTTDVDPNIHTFAIKKVLQDRRYKNRELDIMKMLSHHYHPNVLGLSCYFYQGDYLNLVLDFIPDTLYKLIKQKKKQSVTNETHDLYSVLLWQMCRGLGYLHLLGVCHRDIKPQNVLYDPNNNNIKLCDFGSAKCLVATEPNVAYICSRYYRAPELIFGAQYYTTQIDVWSMGCCFAEMYLGHPIFPGESGVDQLVEIIKVLGSPTTQDVLAMNAQYTDHKFPIIQPQPLVKLLKYANTQSIDLLQKMLMYDPTKRWSAYQCLTHPYFENVGKEYKDLLSQGKLNLFRRDLFETESMGFKIVNI